MAISGPGASDFLRQNFVDEPLQRSEGEFLAVIVDVQEWADSRTAATCGVTLPTYDDVSG